MTIDEARENEIRYCGKNLIYFVKKYGHYEDSDADELIQSFENIWPEQEETLREFETNRLNIVLKARQLGITWLALNYAVWRMLTRPGRTVLGMSRSEDEAKELIRRTVVIIGAMPELVKTKGKGGIWFESTALSVTIHFPDKPSSIMQCFASNENAGRSFTADLLLIDEWAAQSFAREIWGSIYPTVNRPTGGQVIGISTNKRGTLFEDLYTGENSFNKIFLPWYVDPERTEEWHENTKRDIGDVLMAQEYPATAEEALSTPGGAFFPEVLDSSILTDTPLEGNVVTYFAMDYGLDMFAGGFIQRDAFGNSQEIFEINEPNKTVGEAAALIQHYIKSYDLDVSLFLAPPDLWNRSPQTGKSIALMFGEYGINLTKVNNDVAAGCLAMKELLKHGEGKSKFTILNKCAPNLLMCLKKIQHDEKKPKIYAKQPHDLTHQVDMLRYYSIYWTNPASNGEKSKRRKWRRDQYEDYENANAEDKKYLIELWGEPN